MVINLFWILMGLTILVVILLFIFLIYFIFFKIEKEKEIISPEIDDYIKKLDIGI